jgi:hypothetical protein
MITSSGFALGVLFLRTLKGRGNVRDGDPSRRGGLLPPLVMLGAGSKEGLTGEGVAGLGAGINDFLADGVFGPVGTLGVLLADCCKLVRSDKELRRFLRDGPRGTESSPMVASGEFSKLKAPSTVGRSRETGRLGE